MRNLETAPTQDTSAYEIGRGNVLVPPLPESINHPRIAFNYLQDFAISNGENMQEDIESLYDQESLFIPGNTEVPGITFKKRVVDERRKLFFIQSTPSLDGTRQKETLLVALSSLEEDLPYSPKKRYHIDFMWQECADSDRNWGDLEEEFRNEIKEKLPTMKQALEAFVDLIK